MRSVRLSSTEIMKDETEDADVACINHNMNQIDLSEDVQDNQPREDNINEAFVIAQPPI